MSRAIEQWSDDLEHDCDQQCGEAVRDAAISDKEEDEEVDLPRPRLQLL